MIKLYETQSYLTENKTVVTGCFQEKKKIFVTLKESIFFPEEGGQYADTGWLIQGEKKVRLCDGQIKQGQISYEVDTELEVGSEVCCKLDWENRYMRMQQHTGEHILTGTIHNYFGYHNVGFHLSDDAPITLDLDGILTMEQAMEMETLANEVIYKNLPVVDSYPSKEELQTLSYRSKIEIEGQVRLITIPEVDVCACCAPHVAKTGEVGLIKIVSLQNYKGGIRLNILCGKRALLHYREQLLLMSQLANSLSTRPSQVLGIVNSQKEEVQQIRYQLSQMAEKALIKEIESLSDRVNACVFTSRDTSAVAAKNAFNAMTKRFSGYVGIFIGDDEHGYRYHAGSSTLDSRILASLMREKLSAKGGGSKEMVQGKTAVPRQQIEAFFAEL